MKEMTKGNPIKIIFMFSLPILFGNIFQQFYVMADTIMVGRILGVDALAAMGATSALFGLVLFMAIGLVMGFSIKIAQFFGAQDHHSMRLAVVNTFVLTILCGIFFTIVSTVFASPMLELLNTPADIIGMSYDYLIIMFAGTLITMLYNFGACVLRAIGDSKTPLYFLILSSIVNIILDYLFIAEFQMGIAGAAIATLIAQGLSVVLCLMYMVKKYPFLLPHKEDFHCDWKMIGDQFALGISMGLMNSVVSVGSVVLQSAVNSLGATYIAAQTAARKISELFMQPIGSIGMATTTFASQNFGAKKFSRIKEGVKKSIMLGAGMSLFVILISFTCIDFLMSFFVDPSEVEVVGIAAYYMRVNSLFYVALVMVMIYRNVLQGFGKKVVPIVTSVIEMLVKIIATFTFTPILGYTGIVIAEPVAWVLMAIILFVGYHSYVKTLKDAEEETATVIQDAV